MTLIKDESILGLLERLELEKREWIVVDHWDADLSAVGLAHRDDPRRLVYVSTWDEPAGRYYFECETPTGDEPTDYASHAVEDADFETLVRAMEAHLLPGARAIGAVRWQTHGAMKRYFKHWAESDFGTGTVYFEITFDVTDGWATRQIEVYGEVWRWGDMDNWAKYLADQPFSRMELEDEHEIPPDEFERIWSEALTRYTPPKRYYKADADLDEGIVTFYFECTDDWPTRQVEVCGEVCRWGDRGHPKYLGDQSIETSTLGPEYEISAEEFERAWAEALRRCPRPL